MAFLRGFVQCSLPLLVAFLLACMAHSEASALLQNRQAENFSCPESWLQYEKFCVTKGRGNTEKEVATYCDRLGGIGIKGLCIIRAVENDISPSWQRPEDLSETSDFVTDQADMAPYQDDSLVMEGSCPFGWEHYRDLCVKKPWAMRAACALLGATEIHGLCVKHAGMSRLQTRSDFKSAIDMDKRICCCPPMGHNRNNYAC